MSRYLVTMGIRTACFVVAAFGDGVVRWVALVGAVVLPYIAVIGANTVASRGPGGVAPGQGGLPPAALGLPPGVAERVWPSRFEAPSTPALPGREESGPSAPPRPGRAASPPNA